MLGRRLGWNVFLLGQVKALAIKAHESYPELVDAMKKHRAPR